MQKYEDKGRQEAKITKMADNKEVKTKTEKMSG